MLYLSMSAHPFRLRVTFMIGFMSNCALQAQGLDELEGVLIEGPVQTHAPAFKRSHT